MLNLSESDLNQAQLELMRSQRSVSKLENQLAEKDKIIKSANSELVHLKNELNQAQLSLQKGNLR